MPMDPKNTKAYGIFVEQLLDVIESSKIRLKQNEDLSEDDYKQLKSDFHKIKGGAGFFNLDYIAEIAAQLEQYFSTYNSELTNIIGEIQVKLRELETLALNLSSQT
jgi:HPt (histidine-containing phosphotransfer) domain-containing protein